MNLDKTFTLLVAEDDPDDIFITRKAFAKAEERIQLQFVADGRELLDFLLGKGDYAEQGNGDFPCLVVLDLNMPVMDGRAALWEMRNNPDLSELTVVVLTTSDVEEDRKYCDDLGVTSYFVKPASFNRWREIADDISRLCTSN